MHITAVRIDFLCTNLITQIYTRTRSWNLEMRRSLKMYFFVKRNVVLKNAHLRMLGKAVKPKKIMLMLSPDVEKGLEYQNLLV